MEGLFSSIKRIFGEFLTGNVLGGMLHEVGVKLNRYNMLMTLAA